MRFNVEDNARGDQFSKVGAGVVKAQSDLYTPAGYKEINNSDYFDHLIPKVNHQTI